MDRVLYTFTWNSLRNDRREILIDDTARQVRESLLQSKALMTNTATNVSEQGNFGLQAMAKLLIERIAVEECVLTLTTGGHPQIDIIETGRYAQGPLEGHLFCIVAFLENSVGGVGRVLVLGLSKELG